MVPPAPGLGGDTTKGFSNVTHPPPPPSMEQPHPPLLESAELDDIFSSEFAADAEAHLGEAMKMLSSENPELWQQFETFAKSMGMEDNMGAGPVPPGYGAASKGESSVDEGATGGKGTAEEKPRKNEKSGGSSLDQKLDDTIKRMQDNSARLGVGPSSFIPC